MRMLKKMTFLPPKIFIPNMYEYYTGKKLNLNKPIEFNQKIQWYKVYFRVKLLNRLVDKYTVKEYVKEKIGSQYLNETLGVFEKVNQINFEKLPSQFVIKGVHASSYNIIVTDKESLNLRRTKKTLRKWLRTNQYYRTGQEWAYKDVKPKLLVENFINQKGRNSLSDYKFHCFSGKAKFVEVHLDRFSNYKCSLYDLNFNKLSLTDVSMVHMRITEDIKKPDNFEEMIELSEKLADNLPYVRVDLYSVEGKSIFGEMTFYPTDGRKDWVPEEFNKTLGDYFELPKIPNGKKYITQYP